LEALPRPIQARVILLFQRLERWPEVSGVRALGRQLEGHFRARTGDYRVQFQVTGDRLIVEKIGHRDGFDEG